VQTLRELFKEAVTSIKEKGDDWAEEVIEEDLPAIQTHGKIAMVTNIL